VVGRAPRSQALSRAGGRLRSPATFGPTGRGLAARCRPLSTGRVYPLPQPPTRWSARAVPPTPTRWTWPNAATGWPPPASG